MKRFLKNWRTSLAGLATLAAVGFKISQHGFDPMTDLPAILSGTGLLGAKGNNVTGGTSEQDGGTVPSDPPRRKTLWQKQHTPNHPVSGAPLG